jgi:molybdate transport system regulatory protein
LGYIVAEAERPAQLPAIGQRTCAKLGTGVTGMPAPAVRFRVDFGRDVAIGPGKIALLEQIERGGSLSQAARELGMSYRRAWLLLDSLNHCFRERVAVCATGGRRGGGATLTGFGRQLVRVYREFDSETQLRAGRCFQSIARRTRSLGNPGTRRRGNAAPILRLKDR